MTCRVVILPQDIVEDILSRLPVKSLQRFRCLAKSLDSLISDRSFVRMHVRLSSQKILLYFLPCRFLSLDCEKDSSCTGEGAISRLDFPGKTPCYPSRILVVGSCHGLICLALRDENDFYLWNPSTEDYHNLPDPYPCLLPHKPPYMKYFQECVCGFGYDSFSDDYKVLFGLRPPLTLCAPYEKAAIFSTRENCWRIIPQLPLCCTVLFEQYDLIRPASFVNGTLNWLVPQFDGKDFPIYTLVGFDLKTERFSKLPMPEKDTRYRFAALGILGGRLCLSVANYKYSECSSQLIELWVMNEYDVGQSWTRLLNAPFRSPWAQHFPLCLSKDDQIILADMRCGLTRINGEGRKLEEINICNCKLQPKILSCDCEAAIAYLESLVWPFEKQKKAW